MVNEAIAFEPGMAQVQKVADIPDGFIESINDMSTDIPIAATGLLELAAAGGRLGVASDDLIDFTQLAAEMGAAFEISSDKAGDAIARMQSVLGIETLDGVRQVADAMNTLSANAATSEEELLDVAVRSGSVARTFGLSATQTIALATALNEVSPSSNPLGFITVKCPSNIHD